MITLSCSTFQKRNFAGRRATDPAFLGGAYQKLIYRIASGKNLRCHDIPASSCRGATENTLDGLTRVELQYQLEKVPRELRVPATNYRRLSARGYWEIRSADERETKKIVAELSKIPVKTGVKTAYCDLRRDLGADFRRAPLKRPLVCMQENSPSHTFSLCNPSRSAFEGQWAPSQANRTTRGCCSLKHKTIDCMKRSCSNSIKEYRVYETWKPDIPRMFDYMDVRPSDGRQQRHKHILFMGDSVASGFFVGAVWSVFGIPPSSNLTEAQKLFLKKYPRNSPQHCAKSNICSVETETIEFSGRSEASGDDITFSFLPFFAHWCRGRSNKHAEQVDTRLRKILLRLRPDFIAFTSALHDVQDSNSATCASNFPERMKNLQREIGTDSTYKRPIWIALTAAPTNYPKLTLRSQARLYLFRNTLLDNACSLGYYVFDSWLMLAAQRHQASDGRHYPLWLSAEVGTWLVAFILKISRLALP